MGALHAIHAVADVDRPAYDAEPEKREIGFGIVDPQVRALKNGYATAVYEALAAHTNAQGICWPALTTLCEMVGWSKPTVIKAVKALTDAGLVSVEQQRHHGYVIGNRYTLPLRNRTKSTTLNQLPPIMPEAVNDVESGSKPPLLKQSTTLTQAVNDIDSSGKGGLHKQDVVKQEPNKQDNGPSRIYEIALWYSNRVDGVLPGKGAREWQEAKRLASTPITDAEMGELFDWLSGQSWVESISLSLMANKYNEWRSSKQTAPKKYAHNSPRAKGPVF